MEKYQICIQACFDAYQIPFLIKRIQRKTLKTCTKHSVALDVRERKLAVPPFRLFRQTLHKYLSGSPKPHPSNPHPCNMPQAKTEVALQFSGCCAAEVALQHSLFCSADSHFMTKNCAAASEKLQCNIEKAALQKSGAFLPLSCGFQAPTFRTC